jgi:hypothetical protein
MMGLGRDARFFGTSGIGLTQGLSLKEISLYRCPDENGAITT